LGFDQPKGRLKIGDREIGLDMLIDRKEEGILMSGEKV